MYQLLLALTVSAQWQKIGYYTDSLCTDPSVVSITKIDLGTCTTIDQNPYYQQCQAQVGSGSCPNCTTTYSKQGCVFNETYDTSLDYNGRPVVKFNQFLNNQCNGSKSLEAAYPLDKCIQNQQFANSYYYQYDGLGVFNQFIFNQLNCQDFNSQAQGPLNFCSIFNSTWSISNFKPSTTARKTSATLNTVSLLVVVPSISSSKVSITSSSSASPLSSNQQSTILQQIPSSLLTSCVQQTSSVQQTSNVQQTSSVQLLSTVQPTLVTSIVQQTSTVSDQVTSEAHQTSNKLTTSEPSTQVERLVDSIKPSLWSVIGVSELQGYLIVAGSGLGVMLIILTACCMYRRAVRRLKVQRIVKGDTQVNISAEHIGTTYQPATQTQTMVATTHEMSVPAFLELQSGIDFRMVKQIAKGGMGAIYHCQVLNRDRIKGNDKVVVKSMGQDIQQLQKPHADSFFQEIALLWMVRDMPFFAKLFGYSLAPATMLLKFYPFGSLINLIVRPKPLDKLQLMFLLKQLGKGIEYLHQNKVVHCDIKPDNVLIEEAKGFYHPKITDFGISRVLTSYQLQVQAFNISHIRGASVTYAAPEVLFTFKNRINQTDDDVLKAGDVYSLAVVLIELVTRCRVCKE